MGNMKVLVHTAHAEKRQCEVFDAHFIKDGLHSSLLHVLLATHFATNFRIHGLL